MALTPEKIKDGTAVYTYSNYDSSISIEVMYLTELNNQTWGFRSAHQNISQIGEYGRFFIEEAPKKESYFHTEMEALEGALDAINKRILKEQKKKKQVLALIKNKLNS